MTKRTERTVVKRGSEVQRELKARMARASDLWNDVMRAADIFDGSEDGVPDTRYRHLQSAWKAMKAGVTYAVNEMNESLELARRSAEDESNDLKSELRTSDKSIFELQKTVATLKVRLGVGKVEEICSRIGIEEKEIQSITSEIALDFETVS